MQLLWVYSVLQPCWESQVLWALLKYPVLHVSWRSSIWIFQRLGVLISKMKPLQTPVWACGYFKGNYTPALAVTPLVLAEFIRMIVPRLTYSLEEKKKNKRNNFQLPHLSPWTKVWGQLQPALATAGCCRATKKAQTDQNCCNTWQTGMPLNWFIAAPGTSLGT